MTVDPRFYSNVHPLSLKEIIEVSETSLVKLPDEIDEKTIFKNVADLQQATSQDITYFHNKKYQEVFEKTSAGLCFIENKNIKKPPKGTILLISSSAQRSFAQVLQVLYPDIEDLKEVSSSPIHPTAEIGEGTIIDHGALIKAKVKIGKFCQIGANSIIEAGVELGNYTRIGAHTTISHALIGSHVTLYPGVRIGQAGFGFATDGKGFLTIPQLGRVIIEDYVEIGANSTIDRGSLKDTIIGYGSRLDNLVMIAHNVVIGSECIIVAQVGIAGSTNIGKRVIIAGQAGLIGHLNIGNYAQIGAQSGVMRDIAEGEIVFGSPAQPLRKAMKQIAMLNKMIEKPLKRKN